MPGNGYLVGAALVVLAACLLWPLAELLYRRLRRLGLVFVVIAAGFLNSMATKPGPTPPGPTPEPTVYSIAYENTRGAANTNVTSYTTNDTPIVFGPLTNVTGYVFAGWQPASIPKGAASNMTVTAVWTEDPGPTPPGPTPPGPTPPGPTPPGPVTELRLAPLADELPDLDAANTYEGYAYDAGNAIVATIQLKTTKANKDGLSKVTATVVWADGSKTTFKNGYLEAGTEITGEVSSMSTDGFILNAKIGAIGLTGTLGTLSTMFTLDGSRNIFSAKDKYAKDVAADVLESWKCNYNLAWTNVVGMNVLNVSVGAKGKTKVSGLLAENVKASTSAQLSAGKDGDPCGIPVLVTKNAQEAFMIWLTDAGLSVVGLPGAVVSFAEGLTNDCTFVCDTNELAKAVADYAERSGQTINRVLDEFLPRGVKVAPSSDGKKWIVMPGPDGKAAKTGKIVVDKDTGEIDEAKSKIDGYNVSGLKLTYTQKTASFKGSFKVYYVVEKNGRFSLKSVSMSVSGAVVTGAGYGTATHKEIGTFEVLVK